MPANCRAIRPRTDASACHIKFSALLFGATQLGMTVVITEIAALPQGSGTPDVAVQSVASDQNPLALAAYEWHPERSTDGIVSVVISVADQRALVMRDGVEIGSAPVRVGGDVDGATAYVLRAWDNSGMHWLKLRFSGSGEGMEVGSDEGKRFQAPTGFRTAVATILRPGSVVIVTRNRSARGALAKPSRCSRIRIARARRTSPVLFISSPVLVASRD